MFNLLVPIPKKINIAVSGGVDSMVALDFCLLMNKTVNVLHFNHGTKFGKIAEDYVIDFCKNKKIPYVVQQLDKNLDFNGESKQDIWRKERYKFFKEVTQGKELILTAHHLNDAIETWIFTSLHGNSLLIPPKRDNFIRPFLLSEKEKFFSWAERKNIHYLNDPSNEDTSYMRNLIRHQIIPDALKINPGLGKVIKKKYIDMMKGSHV